MDMSNLAQTEPHFELGPDLYRQVRAGFVQQGLTLARWCAERKVHRENARRCLLGQWTGPKARALAATLVREAERLRKERVG